MTQGILEIRGEMYKVKRKFKDHEKWDADILKKLYNCTHVFRSNGELYVCDEITSINYQEL